MLIKNLRRFVALEVDQRWLLAEAVLFLFMAKFLLLILPVKTVIKITLSSKKAKRQADPDLLRQIKWALYNADRLSFWKNRCLVQSIAGRWVLQRKSIPSQLSFGITHDKKGKLIAHAWLKVVDYEIIDMGSKFQELITYQ